VSVSTGVLLAQDDEQSLPADAPTDLEERRKNLESWTFEPVALEAHGWNLHMDRRDSSFFVRARRSGVKLFSSAHRRGFCSVVLADGTVRPIDRVAALDSRDKRLRFRALSSQGELPRVTIEMRPLENFSGLSIGFEVADDARDAVRSVRLLDQALWVSDADGGGVLLPRDLGEWMEPKGAPLEVTLGYRTETVADRDDRKARSPVPCTLPAIGILRGEGPLVLYWDDPRAHVTVTRREETGPGFVGRSGVFVSVDFDGSSGEVKLLVPTDARMEWLELPNILRSFLTATERLPTLRFKTGNSPELRGLVGAALARLRMTEPPGPLNARGEVRYTFSEVAAIAEHWKSDLEIDQALFVLDDWIGSGGGPTSPSWVAAPECGGNEGLQELSARLRGAGHLLGISVDIEQLATPGESVGTPAATWESALRFAAQADGFEALEDLCAPQLLLVRDRDASVRGLKETSAIDATRDAVARHATEVFGLWARSPALLDDLEHSVLVDGILDRRLRDPTSPAIFPFYPACFGDLARMTSSPELALGPDDAAGFLAHLLLGQAAQYEIPLHAYHEREDVELGDGADWCFARPGGWTEGRGLSPRDVFVKNTFEVSSWLARQVARYRLTSHRTLSSDGSVQESYFGPDLRVLVNFGDREYEDEETDTVLPKYGFLVRHPFFRAFHAIKAGGLSYDEPAFFTVRSLEGKMFLRAESVRLYRGFGPKRIRLGGRVFEVDTELRTRIW